MDARRGVHPLVGVGVAQHVEPVAGVADAVLLAGQKAVDQLLVGVGRLVVQEGILLGRRRRNADQIEVDAAQQGTLVRRAHRRDFLCRVDSLDEGVDWVGVVGERGGTSGRTKGCSDHSLGRLSSDGTKGFLVLFGSESTMAFAEAPPFVDTPFGLATALEATGFFAAGLAGFVSSSAAWAKKLPKASERTSGLRLKDIEQAPPNISQFLPRLPFQRRGEGRRGFQWVGGQGGSRPSRDRHRDSPVSGRSARAEKERRARATKRQSLCSRIKLMRRVG